MLGTKKFKESVCNGKKKLCMYRENRQFFLYFQIVINKLFVIVFSLLTFLLQKNIIYILSIEDSVRTSMYPEMDSSNYHFIINIVLFLLSFSLLIHVLLSFCG